MRKSVAVVMTAASLLSGCAGPNAVGSGINAVTIRSALIATCGIMVDAATMANLIGAASSTLTSVDNLAIGVCKAYEAASVPVASARFGIVRRQVAPIVVNVGGIMVPITGAKPL
jgi:hypothetical protein